MPRSRCRLLLTRRQSAPQCRQNDLETVSSDRFFRIFTISIAEEKASLFASPGSHFYVFYISSERHALTKMLQIERVKILSFFIFVRHSRLEYLRPQWKGSFCLRFQAYFTPSHISFNDAISFAYGKLFSVYSSATKLVYDDDDSVIAPSHISLYDHQYCVFVS